MIKITTVVTIELIGHQRGQVIWCEALRTQLHLKAFNDHFDFVYPIFEMVLVSLLLLLGKVNIVGIYLYQCVRLTFLNAFYLYSDWVYLLNYCLRPYCYRTFVVFNVFIIFQFTVSMQLKEAQLDSTIPVFLAKMPYKHQRVLTDGQIVT